VKSFELFSGCGGLAKGLERAGFEHCALVEFNKWACESLRANFDPGIVCEQDARQFDFSTYAPVDLVAGGPPCQPFSLGGLAKAHDDDRDMFPHAARVIRELRPRAFVFENVKGLLRKSFASYFDYIISLLTYPDCLKHEGESWESHAGRLQNLCFQTWDGLKYRVQFKLLNAADYGVPQIRERVFIVGLRNDIAVDWQWPEPSVPLSSRVTVWDAIKHLPPLDGDNLPTDHYFIGGARTYPGHTGSAVDKPSKTIKAGAHGVPGGENMISFPDGSVRYMTIHEAKLIQSFPHDFMVYGSWGEALRQIGNAVPVKLAEIIGVHLRGLLEFATNQYNPSLYRTGTDGAMYLFENNVNTISGQQFQKDVCSTNAKYPAIKKQRVKITNIMRNHSRSFTPFVGGKKCNTLNHSGTPL